MKLFSILIQVSQKLANQLVLASDALFEITFPPNLAMPSASTSCQKQLPNQTLASVTCSFTLKNGFIDKVNITGLCPAGTGCVKNTADQYYLYIPVKNLGNTKPAGSVTFNSYTGQAGGLDIGSGIYTATWPDLTPGGITTTPIVGCD
jgi:hypothetical protein